MIFYLVLTVYLIFISILTILDYQKKRKIRASMEQEIDTMKRHNQVTLHNMLQTEFRLKRAEVLENDIKEDAAAIKQHHTFLASAVRLKVKKVKKSPKRRKKSA